MASLFKVQIRSNQTLDAVLDDLPVKAQLDFRLRCKIVVNRTIEINLEANVVAAPTAAVPEPSTWSLMLTGLGFLGYVLRRRVLRRA